MACWRKKGEDTKLFSMFVRVLVTGLVQGVNFRWAAQGEAKKLGVKGTVRNRSDGMVEVHAEGTEDQVQRFLAELRARDGVKRLDIQRLEGFEIVF